MYSHRRKTILSKLGPTVYAIAYDDLHSFIFGLLF